MKLKILFLIFFPSNILLCQQLYINEFMSSNQGSYLDDYGEPSDWVEIFNNSSQTINLGEYYLSDDPSDLKKWKFPSITIESGDFEIVFASGKDVVTTSGEVHTNFAINSKGEVLTLSKNGEFVHEIKAKSLNYDESFALIPDGGKEGFVQSQATPLNRNVTNNSDYVEFSKLGGIYESSFELTLENKNLTNQIFYTINGDQPTTGSYLYTSPLSLDENLYSMDSLYANLLCPPDMQFTPKGEVKKCIVLKAAVFNQSGDRISPVVTNSYFFKNESNDHEDLPIISLSVSPEDLLDSTNGIMVPGVHWDENNPHWSGNYYQRGENWEKNSHIEYYEPNSTLKLKQDVGLRTHGGNSRRFRQKGFKIYARRDYGLRWLNYRFFPNITTTRFKRLVIKPFASSWSGSGIENSVSNQIVQNLKSDHLANHPVLLYLNGEYWGVYYIEERIDNRYLNTYYNVNEDEVDIIDNWSGKVREGNNENYKQLYEFIENNDLSINENYQTVNNWIDIENFIDYQLFEIFIANYDWPANNMRLWRERKEGKKWRWIFFDGDGGYSGFDFNALEHALAEHNNTWSTSPVATLFLRKLLENDLFKNQFINRLDFLLENELKPENTLKYFEKIKQLIEHEVPDQIKHFDFPDNLSLWSDTTDHMEKYFNYRHCEIKKHFNERFGDYFDLIDDCELSKGQISNLNIYPNPNNGKFRTSFNLESAGRVEVTIINMIGKPTRLINQFMEKGENEIEVNSTNLSSGVYILKVNNRNEAFTKKLIITK
ncbi:MAG: CotH kinase family protein [Brumimicrobium sp.]